jgi:hypothetical protein
MKFRPLLFGFAATIAGCTAPPIDSDAWVEKNSCESLWARKKAPRWTWEQYAEILAELKKPRYLVVPMAEFQHAVSTQSDKVVIGLRHDLDGNICAARTMAQMEQQAGIRATYFLNHNDAYYAWHDEQGKRHRREASVYRYREIADMGHEIGLHYDMLGSYFEHGEDPAALLTEELAWLAAHGFQVRGGAAHGSRTAREAGFVNYEVFTGMTRGREGAVLDFRNRSYKLGTLKYADFLTYETYHLGTNAKYYSEAGGAWGDHPLDPNKGVGSLKPGQSAQILIHPVWWGSAKPKPEGP